MFNANTHTALPTLYASSASAFRSRYICSNSDEKELFEEKGIRRQENKIYGNIEEEIIIMPEI